MQGVVKDTITRNLLSNTHNLVCQLIPEYRTDKPVIVITITGYHLIHCIVLILRCKTCLCTYTPMPGVHLDGVHHTLIPTDIIVVNVTTDRFCTNMPILSAAYSGRHCHPISNKRREDNVALVKAGVDQAGTFIPAILVPNPKRMVQSVTSRTTLDFSLIIFYNVLCMTKTNQGASNEYQVSILYSHRFNLGR